MEIPAIELSPIDNTTSDGQLLTGTVRSQSGDVINSIESTTASYASSPTSEFFNFSDGITRAVSVDIVGRVLPTVVPTHLPVWVQIIVSVIVLIFVLVTITGNLLVITAFCRYKHLQTYTHYYILSLSIADLMVGCVCMPLYGLVFILGYWPFDEIFCDVLTYS